MKQARRHNDHGFTLTEMLVTVTIVIVLFALAMIPISKMRREVRQTELDSRAELIFMAAQNQLTQLQAAGRTSAYQGAWRWAMSQRTPKMKMKNMTPIRSLT